MDQKHVVVVGGGFAGINLAQNLAGQEEVRVTLVDGNNYNYFQPLLYQVATGLLEVSSITLPFRTVLKGVENVRFRLGTLERVDPANQTIHLSTGDVEYDVLVIATGTRTNYFGLAGVEGAKVHPGVAGFETLLAIFRSARLHGANLVEVGAPDRHPVLPFHLWIDATIRGRRKARSSLACRVAAVAAMSVGRSVSRT